MKKIITLFLLVVGPLGFSQFVVKETEFEWFSKEMRSNRCAIEAIVPKADGSVEVNTFTQALSAIMIQTGIFAGSANGYKYHPLMNSKQFDAELKLKSNKDDYYNYRMFLPKDKQEKKLFLMLNDRMSENVEVPFDSNYLEDMARKYPKAVKPYGEGQTFFHISANDPPEDTKLKYITVTGNTYFNYDLRANIYQEKPTEPAYINPVVEKRTDGKKMEAMELLMTEDRSLLQRYAFFSPSDKTDKWEIYKHRIIPSYNKDGMKINEATVDMEYPRKESYIAEVRNVEDNKTNGFLYIYHRVLGLSKKNLDTVMGNYEVVYLDRAGNKKFQYIFKLTEKANRVNPFVSYAKDGKIHLLFFGHPDSKTAAVTSFVLTPTGVEEVQSMPLQEWQSQIDGQGVALRAWTDDGFLLHDAIQDKNGFIYLIGEKRTKESIPGTPQQAGGMTPMPTPIHIYPSHIVLVIGPDGKPVKQHVIQKTPLSVPVWDKSYELISNDQGVFVVYKDIVAPGVIKPLHAMTLSNLQEVNKNVEPYEYKVTVLGLNGASTKLYTLPTNLYHSEKGYAWDSKKQNLFLIGVNPATGNPKLTKVALW